MAMTLVSRVTVGSGGAASIEFTGIPQSGKDLLIKLSGRSSTTNYVVRLILNNDTTGTNYPGKDMEGSGTSTTTGVYTDASYLLLIAQSTDTGSTFGNSEAYIANYTSSSNKSIANDNVNENNSTNAYQRLSTVTFITSSTITALKLQTISGTLVQNSTASLYIIS